MVGRGTTVSNCKPAVSQVENSSSDHQFAGHGSASRTRAELRPLKTATPHIEQQNTDQNTDIAGAAAGSFEPTATDVGQTPSLDLHREQLALRQSPRELERVASRLKLWGLALALLLLSPVIAVGLYFLITGN